MSGIKSHIVIREKKTGKKKRFPINAELREIINTYIKGKKDEYPLFPSRKTGRNIDRVQAYRILNRAAAEVGLAEIGTHTLRKTFGYHFYKRYKDGGTSPADFQPFGSVYHHEIHRDRSRHYRSGN